MFTSSLTFDRAHRTLPSFAAGNLLSNPGLLARAAGQENLRENASVTASEEFVGAI